MTNKILLDFYSASGQFTECGSHLTAIRKLPADIATLTEIVQGLAIHMFTAKSFYNVKISDSRIENEAHIRHFDKLLGKIRELDSNSFEKPRMNEKKIVGVCHHFSKLLTGILRAKQVPARMRYGFGNYFNVGYFEDHSVCEYWNNKDQRWVIVDPQFDAVWVKNLNIKHNILDIPDDRFFNPAESWILCRQRKTSAEKFGIFQPEMRGLWFIAGNLVKDVASLQKLELLQWDSWGGMPKPNDPMRNDKMLDFFDELAEKMRDPDKNYLEIQKQYKNIEMTGQVFNSLRRRLEVVSD